jgi:hypothetical protein
VSSAHKEGEALIIENNKSRKIKEFKSNVETALWFVESYGLVPHHMRAVIRRSEMEKLQVICAIEGLQQVNLR